MNAQLLIRDGIRQAIRNATDMIAIVVDPDEIDALQSNMTELQHTLQAAADRWFSDNIAQDTANG